MPTALVRDQFDVDHDGETVVIIPRIAIVAPCMERRIARWIIRRKTGIVVVIRFFDEVQHRLAGGLEDALEGRQHPLANSRHLSSSMLF